MIRDCRKKKRIDEQKALEEQRKIQQANPPNNNNKPLPTNRISSLPCLKIALPNNNSHVLALTCEEEEIQLAVDTGSATTCITTATWERVLQRARKKKRKIILEKPSVHLKTADGTSMTVLGEYVAKLKHKNGTKIPTIIRVVQNLTTDHLDATLLTQQSSTTETNTLFINTIPRSHSNTPTPITSLHSNSTLLSNREQYPSIGSPLTIPTNTRWY